MTHVYAKISKRLVHIKEIHNRKFAGIDFQQKGQIFDDFIIYN